MTTSKLVPVFTENNSHLFADFLTPELTDKLQTETGWTRPLLCNTPAFDIISTVGGDGPQGTIVPGIRISHVFVKHNDQVFVIADFEDKEETRSNTGVGEWVSYFFNRTIGENAVLFKIGVDLDTTTGRTAIACSAVYTDGSNTSHFIDNVAIAIEANVYDL